MRTAVRNYETYLKDHNSKAFTQLNLSLNLTFAARDLVCELGHLSIVATNQNDQELDLKDHLSYKYVKKYATDGGMTSSSNQQNRVKSGLVLNNPATSVSKSVASSGGGVSS